MVGYGVVMGSAIRGSREKRVDGPLKVVVKRSKISPMGKTVLGHDLSGSMLVVGKNKVKLERSDSCRVDMYLDWLQTEIEECDGR